MNAITFLRAKGILTADCTKWKVKFKGGKEFDVVKLLEEYADSKLKDQNKFQYDERLNKL